MVTAGIFTEAYEPGRRNGNGAATTDASRAPTPALQQVAAAKGCPADGLIAFGAVERDGKLVLPMYGRENGRWKQCSYFTMDTAGKGLNAKGLPAGVFLPCHGPDPQIPGPGELWCIVEGAKDAAALHGLGYMAVGLPGNAMKKDIAPGFRGMKICIVPDLDVNGAGEHGAAVTAERLQGIAESIYIARLPGNPESGRSVDVRDVLESHGADAVHKVIAEAQPAGLLSQAGAAAWLQGTRVSAIDRGNIGTVVEDCGTSCVVKFVSPDGNVATKELPKLDLRPLGGERLAEPPRFLSTLTSAELVALDARPRFLVRDVLVAGQPGVTGGRSKTLKTGVDIDLAVSLASGTPFLGRFDVPVAVPVGLWSGESGTATIRETAVRVSEARGVDLATLPIHWGFDLPKLSLGDHVEAMDDLVHKLQLQVIIVDPLYLSLLSVGSAVRPGDV